jgi:hypothetical protein
MQQMNMIYEVARVNVADNSPRNRSAIKFRGKRF